MDAFSSAPSVSLNTNWSLGLRVSVCLMILSPRYTRNRICIGNLLSGDFLTEEVSIPNNLFRIRLLNLTLCLYCGNIKVVLHSILYNPHIKLKSNLLFSFE